MILASRRTLIWMLIAFLVIWGCWIGFKVFYIYGGNDGEMDIDGKGISSITVDANTASIYISPSDDDDIHISYSKVGAIDKRISAKTLEISQSDVKFNLKAVIEIELPSSIESLRIKNHIGEVDIAAVNIDLIDIKATTGDILATDIASTNTSLTTTTGSITVTVTDSKDVLKAQTTTGDVEIENSSSQAILAKTTTGDVEIMNCKFDSIEASATTGDIDIDLIRKEGTIDASTGNLGAIYIFGDKMEGSSNKVYNNTNPSIKARTNLGEIDIR